MKLIKLQLSYAHELLRLEEELYWQSKDWSDLWQREAKERFRGFIENYLTDFPEGCFGLVDEMGQFMGAMFLIKVSKLEPIPYLHKMSDYLDKKGQTAYVSFFVVKRGHKEKEIAQKLYAEAEEIALLKLGCKAMAVVIYSSPLEEEILKGNNYEKLNKQFEWEIYPGKKVPCFLYHYELLMKEEK